MTAANETALRTRRICSHERDRGILPVVLGLRRVGREDPIDVVSVQCDAPADQER